MMRSLRVRHLANSSGNQHFELDRDGRLFDPSAREGMTRMAGKNPLLALEALAALRLAANRVHTARERWTESHGLSESRLRILTALFYSPEHRRPLGELAEMLGVVPRTMTDVVDVLERDGLIRRAPDPRDRRSVHAQLTRAGLERIEALRRDAVAQEAALFSSFKRGQLAELRHLCLLLVEHLATSKGGS